MVFLPTLPPAKPGVDEGRDFEDGFWRRVLCEISGFVIVGDIRVVERRIEVGFVGTPMRCWMPQRT